jgi:hypothetical protein
MAAVMIRCPETGREIPTGIVTDRESFEATPVFFARVLCPICRTEHEWFAKEAWLCEPAAEVNKTVTRQPPSSPRRYDRDRRPARRA